MTTSISKIRFLCEEHNVPLKNCGNGRIFTPTYTICPLEDHEDELSVRMDDEGWLFLDTSEMYCPCDSEDEPCGQDWIVEAE